MGWAVRAGSQVMVVVAAVAVVAGCGSGDAVDSEPTGAPASSVAESSETTTSTTAVPAGCPAPDVWDTGAPGSEKLKVALTTSDLPLGACVTVVSPVERHNRPDQWSAFYIGVEVPAATEPEDLRPVATEIARIWKADDIAQRTDELMVTNTYPVQYNDYLVDADFRNHPWDGTPSREAELAIWHITALG